MQEGTNSAWNGAVSNVNAAGRGDPVAIGSFVAGAAVPVPEAEGGTISNVASETMETESASTTTLLQSNVAQGAVWEDAVGASFKQNDLGTASQVTLKTQSGVSTRMDFVSKDASGSVVLTEAKSSATASLTKNQAAAHPEIAATGATVTGNGKPGYPGGTRYLLHPVKL